MKISQKISCLLVCLAFMGMAVLSAQTVGNGKPGKPELQGIFDKQVTLSWQSAEKVYGIFDNFEDHANFAINSAGEVGWQYIDMDKDNEYLIGDYIFASSGQPSAFRIWNPTATVPVYQGGRGKPHSGDKCLISFATLKNYRNDWVISPDLTSFNFTDSITLSFWARTFNKQRDEGLELINVCYSTTNLNPSSFTNLNRTPIEVPESTVDHPDMYYFEYKFPANAKYIAINCVTYSGQALLIDDIAIATNKLAPNKGANNYVLGYNLYRGETKVNTDLILGTTATDLVPDFGTYAYTVEAVFEDGKKVKSESENIIVPNHHLLPFYEDWKSYDFATNFWVLPSDNIDGSWEKWRIGYKDGGLVEYAAQYSPRFSYNAYGPSSLTSKELDATGLDGVMMCYDLAAEFYTLTGAENKEDYFKVEVAISGSSEWTEVKKHIHNLKDDRGFNYTRFYIDLTNLVAGKKFQIRFTGGGENAANLAGTSNGWFIKYIRVYEKAQANLSGKVTCAGAPVEGAAITFTGTEGDIYKTTTDASGNYTIEGVDKGRYVVKSLAKAYNPYKSEEIAVEKGAKTVDIAMTQPVIAVNAAKTYTLKAEETTLDKIVLNNTGTGEATVRLTLDYGTITGKTPRLKSIATFRPKDVLEAAICFDGTYFYTAKSHEFAEGVVSKYDRDGNFIESFTPSIHVRRYFGIVFDGRYFYTANHDSIIRKIDFETHEIVEEIPVNISNINHIAYNAERDAFYVGSLNTIALVSKTGEILEEEYILEDCLFAGSVYDPYFKDGPTMWIVDQKQLNNSANAYTNAVIRRFDLETKEVVDDYEFDCSELPGFVWGTPSTGLVWGEGLFGTTLYKEGHFVMMGVMLSDPGLIYILDMYETDNWVKPSTYSVKVAPGETKEIPYTIDAADFADGKSAEAKIHLKFDPAIADGLHKVNLTVEGKAPLAKPTLLTATAQNDRAVVLSWSAPAHVEGSAPTSFKIYRNDIEVGTAAGATTYTDNNLKGGLYQYAVTAVYAGGESKKSNTAEAEILIGVPCYGVQGLTAKAVRNKDIVLSWRNPSDVGNVATTLRWDNGRMDDTVSAYGATFMGAALWTPSDLADYRNMKFEAVTFIPVTAGGNYAIKIWQGNNLVHEQEVGKAFTPKQPYTVKLNKAITINDGENLRVAVLAGAGSALSVDAGPAVQGRGNLVFYDAGSRWETLYIMGGGNGNFNIALELKPKEQPETNTAKGYNIYRNGVKLNATVVTGTTYTDTPSEPGLYTYMVTALHESCESYGTSMVKGRIVDLNAHPAPEDLSARITMNRAVQLSWNYPNTHLDAASSAKMSAAKAEAAYQPFGYVKDFNLKGTAEAAVVTDGEYIYTSFYNANGAFNQYTLSGEFVRSFTINGVGPIIDLTYDGRYFYGGDATTTSLYCMDFDTKTLVKKMDVTSVVRHCAYIPELDGGRGGFEIGDWTTSYFVATNGAYLDRGYQSPEGAFGSAYHDGKLYYFQQKSPSRCEMIEVDFATLKPTGNKAYLNEYSQYAVNTGARAGGLSTFSSRSGSTMLLANIQNAGSPNKLVWVEASQNIYVTGFNLYRDDKKLNTEPLSSREFAEELTSAGEYNYKVAAIYIDGEEGEKSSALKVKIVNPAHCEAPVNVKAMVKDRDVQLQWTSVVDQSAPKDDMENYAHLATGTIGNYSTLDGDAQPTYTPSAWSFDKAGAAGSFYVLDQRSLSPAQTDLAYSGNQFLAAFAALKSETDDVTYTRDWIIIPVAASSQWMSFVARGLETAGKESFRVSYSQSGTDTTNFVRITKTAEEVNCLWKRFVFDLPAGTKYVAIEYVSGNGAALLIDDLSISSGACVFRPEAAVGANETFVEKVVGYYLYRDGTPLNIEPILANAWFDGNLPNGQYQYTVKALYNTSCESGASAVAEAKVQYVAPQTAPRDLAGKANKDSVTLTWKAPAYAPARTITYSHSQENFAMGFYNDATYYTAYHWQVGELLGVYGYQIEAVDGLFTTKPTKLELVIFQDGRLMYTQDVTSACKEAKVSMFHLTEPFEVDYTKSLTVGFRIEAVAEALTMMYDKGPVTAYRGDYFSNDGVTWGSADYYHGTKGNWKINVYLGFRTPSAGLQNGLKGYLVYRDGDPLNKDGLIQELQYKDHGLRAGFHTFEVSAVYEDDEQKSEAIRVNVSGSSANELLDENRLRLYPNPTSDRFTVYGAFDRLDITDMDGRLCVRHYAAQGDEVNVSGLSAGVYVVRIICREGVAVRKLVVTK